MKEQTLSWCFSCTKAINSDLWLTSLSPSPSASFPRVRLFSWPTYTELPVWTLTEGRATQQQQKLSFRATWPHPSLTPFLSCALSLTTSRLSPDTFIHCNNTKLSTGCTDAHKQHTSQLSLVVLTQCQMMCWFNSVLTFKAVVCHVWSYSVYYSLSSFTYFYSLGWKMELWNPLKYKFPKCISWVNCKCHKVWVTNFQLL